MEVIIQKWGNSNAIRIPKLVLKTTGLKENDKVDIVMQDEGFLVKKSTNHISLAERVESFYGKPIDEIETIKSKEVDFGNPVGEEIW